MSFADHALADALPVPTWLASSDGLLTFVNRRWVEVTGVNVPEALRGGLEAVVHPDDRHRLAAVWPPVVAVDPSASRERRTELRVRGADGDYAWFRVQVTPLRTASDAPAQWVGSAIDIAAPIATHAADAAQHELITTRRQRDAALLAGEIGTFEWDTVRQRVWGDQNFRRMFGIRFEADGTAPLERYIDVIHPDDRARMREAVRRTVEDGADYEVEYRVLVNGGTRWLLVRAQPEQDVPVPGGAPRVVRAAGVCLDITGRKNAEHESRRGTRLLQAISDATGDVIYAKDREGRLTYGNPATFALIGKPESEVLGRTDADVLNDPDAARRVMENDQRVMTTGVPEEIEEEVPLPDGTRRVWLSSKLPYHDEAGRVAGLLGVSRDITERVEARRRLAAALSAGEVGVFEWDIASGRIFGDANFSRLFGVAVDERGSAPLADFLGAIHPADLPMVQARIAHALASGEPYEAEYRIVRAGACAVDATTGEAACWVVARGTVERDSSSGRPVRVPGTVLDISARVAAEAAERAARATAEAERARAEQARHVAEAANAAKATFLAKMSHELRTPLHGIGGHIQLIELGIHGPVTDEQRGALARVQRAKHQLISLVNDVLHYAKIESGHEAFHIEPVFLERVIAEAVQVVEPQLRAKGLAIAVDLADAPPEALADHEKLGRILVNLLGNAVKFTEATNAVTGEPGRITVSVHTPEHPAESHPSSRVQVRIADNGIGVPVDQHERVFEPFVQLRSATQREPEGTGLGLAISRDLARAMGGDLWVESEVGVGSTFVVALRAVEGGGTTRT